MTTLHFMGPSGDQGLTVEGDSPGCSTWNKGGFPPVPPLTMPLHGLTGYTFAYGVESVGFSETVIDSVTIC